MITFLLIAAAVGALAGGYVGFKVGRTTERFRPSAKEKKDDEEGRERKKLPRAFGK